MTTFLETGMVKGGDQFATLEMVASLRSIFVGKAFILPYAPTALEPWWLYPFGQVLNVADFPVLGALYGSTYGGNGTTTFGLPDYRGRTIVGVDNMGGVSANRLTGQTGGLNGDILGAVGGAEVHALSTAQLPKFTPTITLSPTTITSQTVISNGGGAGGGGGDTVFRGPDAATNMAATSNEIGGNATHNNVQPSIAQFICILAY